MYKLFLSSSFYALLEFLLQVLALIVAEKLLSFDRVKQLVHKLKGDGTSTTIHPPLQSKYISANLGNDDTTTSRRPARSTSTLHSRNTTHPTTSANLTLETTNSNTPNNAFTASTNDNTHSSRKDHTSSETQTQMENFISAFGILLNLTLSSFLFPNEWYLGVMLWYICLFILFGIPLLSRRNVLFISKT